MASPANRTSVILNFVLRMAKTGQPYSLASQQTNTQDVGGSESLTFFAQGSFPGCPAETLSNGFLDRCEKLLINLCVE